MVKSPKLTADWENALTLVAKGEYSMQEFMGGIEDMVRDLVQTYQDGGAYPCTNPSYLYLSAEAYLNSLETE